MKPNQSRVVIERIFPVLDHEDLYLKLTVGESLKLEADILGDGHDVVAASLNVRQKGARNWQEIRMNEVGNDRWAGVWTPEKEGAYEYFMEGWIDWPLTWLHGTKRKLEDGQEPVSEFLEGAAYLEELSQRSNKANTKKVQGWISTLKDSSNLEPAKALIWNEELKKYFVQHATKALSQKTSTFKVLVEREKARFSTWYEFFPRSASNVEGQHGTFKDCEALLPRVAEMGFDTLYFPPVHPIGEVNRKGKNNATTAQPGDVGSPWGIGSASGGHMSLHPELGSENDFKSLVAKAKELGIEIAMDFALQAAPDHPWVKSNPQWFKWRPDGTVQYAENPPKKYQDILPIFFDTPDWKNLWDELLKSALYWVENFGVRVFRVDNPHTKPYNFWGWLIREVQKKYPEVMFLAEAFTRPKVMEQLAKQGFTQSYTYFTWRTSKAEIIEYMIELTQTDRKYYFRPNFWPNTPDINPWHLQGGNESIYLQRYALAATLSSNIGVYGPVYEFQDSAAVPGREEYHNSEKYQLRHWDWQKETTIGKIISLLNNARKEWPALQQTNNIEFLPIENDALIAFRKWSLDGSQNVIVVVSLDPHNKQIGTVQLPHEGEAWMGGRPLKVEDYITGDSYHWEPNSAYIELHPAMPFHVFNVNFL